VNLERQAAELLERALLTIEASQYFDASPDAPRIDAALGVIHLKIHLQFHGAERLLARGPAWRAARRHPYVKIEQRWRDETLFRYTYDLIDRAFDYEEGFHLHPEADGVWHHHRSRQGRQTTWAKLDHETSLESALDALVASIWRLRG
jgi:hypothetical protein